MERSCQSLGVYSQEASQIVFSRRAVLIMLFILFLLSGRFLSFLSSTASLDTILFWEARARAWEHGGKKGRCEGIKIYPCFFLSSVDGPCVA